MRPALALVLLLAACGGPSGAYEAVALVDIAPPGSKDGSPRALTDDDETYLETLVEKIRTSDAAAVDARAKLHVRRVEDSWTIEVAAVGDDPAPLADAANAAAQAFVDGETRRAFPDERQSVLERRTAELDAAAAALDAEHATKVAMLGTSAPVAESTRLERRRDELVLQRLRLESRLRRSEGEEFREIDDEIKTLVGAITGMDKERMAAAEAKAELDRLAERRTNLRNDRDAAARELATIVEQSVRRVAPAKIVSRATTPTTPR